MKQSHKRTVESMAAAAERIGEELARAKRNIADSAADTGDDLAAELRRLQDDLNAVKDTIANFGETSRAEAAGAASRIHATAKEAAAGLADNAKQDAHSLLAELEDYARQNPQYVVGGAIGLGLLLGLFLRRR
jgi:ElaB/YqjD/DUF883 family membrane-anchored ribosome-binding protein